MGYEERITHDDEIKAVLCAKLGECTDRAHLVWLKALRVGARVVKLDHVRADIYTYKARDVRRQRTRDLSCIYESEFFFFSSWHAALGTLALALGTVPEPHA